MQSHSSQIWYIDSRIDQIGPGYFHMGTRDMCIMEWMIPLLIGFRDQYSLLLQYEILEKLETYIQYYVDYTYNSGFSD